MIIDPRSSRICPSAEIHSYIIFQSENVDFPFVFGFVKPKIYLPFNVDCLDLDHVVAHEVSHIRRKDHWWKPLGFLLLVFNWVNPLMWLAYVLLCRDIELTCDENVIRKLDCEQRADYAQALVACSVKRHTISTYPLAFGEINVKDRVRSILHYRKPTFWIILMSILMCIAMCVFFLTDPKQDSFRLEIRVPAGSREAVLYADEELSPLSDRITVSFVDTHEDAEVFLTPVVATTDASYDESIHLTSAEVNADKGSWFKIGVVMQNDTNKDRIFYIYVKNVEIRTAEEADTSASLIEFQLLEILDSYLKYDRDSRAGHISGKNENGGMSQDPQSGELIHVTHNETPEPDPENMSVATDPTRYPVTGGSIMFDPTVGAVAGSKGEIAEVSIPAEIDGVIVAAIGNSAFRSSSHLTSITIPNSVTTIGDDVFFSCYNLTAVTVPSSVTAIGNGAFSGCYKLKDIYYGGSEEQWEQLDKGNNDFSSAVIHYGADV